MYKRGPLKHTTCTIMLLNVCLSNYGHIVVSDSETYLLTSHEALGISG